MQNLITTFMDKFGYFGIMLLIAIENIFPPIPSEVILTFGGFMTTYTSMHVVGVVFFSTVGSVVGAIVLYLAGRLFHKERLIKVVNGPMGRLLHLKAKDVESAYGWFEKRGTMTVFFCRFVPIVRSLISIPAGMSKMPFALFLLLTTAGSFIWNAVLVFVGSKVGQNWKKVVAVMETYSDVTLLVLVIVFFSIFACFYFKSRKN